MPRWRRLFWLVLRSTVFPANWAILRTRSKQRYDQVNFAIYLFCSVTDYQMICLVSHFCAFSHTTYSRWLNETASCALFLSTVWLRITYIYPGTIPKRLLAMIHATFWKPEATSIKVFRPCLRVIITTTASSWFMRCRDGVKGLHSSSVALQFPLH